MAEINCSSAIREIAERQVKAHYSSAQTLEVDFLVEGSLIDDYAVIEYQAISMASAKFHWKVPFSMGDFIKYCKTIVASRIAWTINLMESVIVYPTDNIMVPSLIDNICKQIGVCTNTKLGITLKPKMCPTEVDGTSLVLKHEEMEKISFFLTSLSDYVGARGYLRDKSGVWDFMTMQLIENQIKNPSIDPHPVYSVFAAVIGPRLIGSALNPLVTYGDLDVYRSLLWQLTSI